jgi:hypothetical protein
MRYLLNYIKIQRKNVVLTFNVINTNRVTLSYIIILYCNVHSFLLLYSPTYNKHQLLLLQSTMPFQLKVRVWKTRQRKSGNSKALCYGEEENTKKSCFWYKICVVVLLSCFFTVPVSKVVAWIIRSN